MTIDARPLAHPSLRFAGVLVALLAALLLAGCGSSEGATTDCNLQSCTVTFERGTDAKVEILGVEARLVGVEGENVILEIAGNQVTAPVGQQVQVQGFQVEVQEVTETEVVVKISGGEGGGG